ncbi:hypothetical protein D3C86_1598150 [compost metagenome]
MRPHLLLGAQDDALLQHLGDAGAPFAVTAVEDQQVVTRLQPHHLGQVARLVEGRSDGEAGGEVALNVQTDHAAQWGQRVRAIKSFMISLVPP